MTTRPAMIRVVARNEIDLMPITSSASISSLMRMAPSSAVAPAPTVAASAMTGDDRGGDAHVDQCGEETGERLDTDVAQRREALDGDQGAPGQGDEADDGDGAADDGHRAGAHPDLGNDSRSSLLAVAAQGVRDLPDAVSANQAIWPISTSGRGRGVRRSD